LRDHRSLFPLFGFRLALLVGRALTAISSRVRRFASIRT
jgi:hypothetical protein